MRWTTLGVLLLLIAPAPASAELYAFGQPAAAQRADHRGRTSVAPAMSRDAARAVRLTLIPCRTGFQLFRREGPLLKAGGFAERCTTYGGVMSFN